MLLAKIFTQKISYFGKTPRCFSEGRCTAAKYNYPITADELFRYAGIPSMFRLPVHRDSRGLNACFVGVPLDSGVSYRSGTRAGPRQMRTESALLKASNKDTGAVPYESLQVADIGDVYFNPFNLPEAVGQIRQAFSQIVATGCKPLTLGGEHTITYPILQALQEMYGAVGLVHIDAHTDIMDTTNGAKLAHGTIIRRCVEDGLLDTRRVVQIGIRGTGWTTDADDWGHQQGFRVIHARHCWFKSLEPLMEEVRQQMGDGPVYISFDIDALDPSVAPGTGAPEAAGLTSSQALEIIRGCKGLNVVGGDLVEVSPPYDTTGNTALLGATMLFEMLCVLPGVKFNNLSI